jgi:caspase domain-containing protein/glucodextranase-like protein
MKNSFFIGIAFVLVSVLGHSQSSFRDYNEGDKLSRFYDSFSNNNKNWKVEDNKDHSFSIRNNLYVLKDKDDYAWDVADQIITVAKNEDFEIEFKAKLNYYSSSGGIYLFFGEKYRNSNLVGIAGKESTCFKSGSYDDMKKYTDNDYVKYIMDYTRFNTFVLRKVKNKIYFFCNRDMVFSSPIDWIPIQRIGFMFSNNNSIEIDYFKVSILKSTGSGSYASTSSSDNPRSNDGLLFFDDFLNNKNNWIVGNTDDYSATIRGGYYVMTDNNNSGWDEFFQPISISRNEDFEIEYKAKFVYQNKYSSIRMFFGESYKKSNLISANGLESTGFNSGTYSKDRLYSNEKYIRYKIDYSAFNVYRLKKVRNTISFYYNDALVFESSELEWIPIKQIGFMFSGKNSIELDYIKVRLLGSSPDNKSDVAFANPKTQIPAKARIDKTPPKILISFPDVSRGFKIIEQSKKITIKGTVSDPNGIFEVLVNGEEAFVDASGNFSKTVLLAFGSNSFTVSATDLKQNTATKQFKIERKSGQQEVVVINKPSTNNSFPIGKYYALIIGVQDYHDPDITDLDHPLSDAQRVYQVLTSIYTFEAENVKFLKNPSKNEITKSLDFYFGSITENDNLLVFYAGHGYWDENFEQGYWLSADADRDNRGTWLSNGTLRDYMRAIPAKHSLLITDACFGGGIFKSRDAFANSSVAINKLFELPSRKAMTSGALKEVPDKSVFVEYLVKRLEQNTETYLSSEQLFASFKIAVINNSSNGQVPQFGEVKETGDEGGDFIFIRK